ncbi:MAG: hypothetical protein L6Q37_15420 [Bdellovibrionaceae bacterium]|nr:hypothetical protein [Pseudobdellovibrionaceae bacterium]NUM60045.1 hypothetical protein [Pseudobdellovibrionaceae bacterium]
MKLFFKPLFSNPLFWAGLIVRLFLLFTESHGVMKDFFIPFVDYGIQHPLNNPWNQLPAEYFPYGIVLYLFMALPKFFCHLFFGDMALGTTAISFALMKLPLLLFDLLFFKLLLRMTHFRLNHLLLFYWLNPVVIYISFIHGQLDIIPMYFSFLAINFTGQNKVISSALFSSMALLSKFHTLIMIPLILVYFWNNDFVTMALKKIRTWILFFSIPTLLGLYPLISSGKMAYNSMGSPEALRIFSLSHSLTGSISLYLGLMIVIFILGRLLLSTKMSAEGLLYSCALSYGSLLVVTHAMPGWYFWIIPFLTIFLSTYNFAPRILYFLFIIFYFLSFSSLFSSLQIIPFYQGITFSLLQLIVISLLVFIYLMALKKQAPFHRRLQPLSIGIAGNSGAGKNLISTSLVHLFGSSTTQIIEGDDYHKWERGNIKWQDYTHLHPRANHLSHLREHFFNLNHGRLIFQKHYDHSSGQFTEPRPLAPTRTLIVQGLHTLYLRSLRDLYDLKIYISPDENLRAAWKIKRDCGERGYSLEKVLNSLKSREKDSASFVQPQKEVADIIIEYNAMSDLSPEKVLALDKIDFNMKLILWNDNILEDLIESLMSVKTLTVELKDEEDLNRVGIIFTGYITQQEVWSIAQTVIPNQRSVTRSRKEPEWQKDYIGIMQLFIMKILAEKI